MHRASTAEQQSECTVNYCHECCAFHTSLLSGPHKYKCERDCLTNEQEAHQTETLFDHTVQRCVHRGDDNKPSLLCSPVSLFHVKKKAKRSSNSFQKDAECLFQACHLCCLNSSTGTASGNPWAQREAEECSSRCPSYTPFLNSLEANEL